MLYTTSVPDCGNMDGDYLYTGK